MLVMHARLVIQLALRYATQQSAAATALQLATLQFAALSNQYGKSVKSVV